MSRAAKEENHRKERIEKERTTWFVLLGFSAILLNVVGILVNLLNFVLRCI